MRSYSPIINPQQYASNVTGITINDLEFNNADLLKLTNASGGIITGIKAGYDGQILYIVSTGGGNFQFKTENANSSAANRLICFSAAGTSGNYITALGTATFQYDAVTARWRMIHSEQGSPIQYFLTWANLSTQPAIGNGTISGFWVTRGRNVDVNIFLSIGSTTTFGTGGLWLFSLPFPFLGTTNPAGAAVVSNGGTNNVGISLITTAFHGDGDIIITLGTAGNVGNAVPAGMTTGDFLRTSISYTIN